MLRRLNVNCTLNPVAIDSASVQEKILTIETHRRNYEQSITGWYGFFSRFSKAQQQREKINHELKNHIADLVIPACNLSDREGVVTEDQLKAQQQRIQELEHKKTHLETKYSKSPGNSDSNGSKSLSLIVSDGFLILTNDNTTYSQRALPAVLFKSALKRL